MADVDAAREKLRAMQDAAVKGIVRPGKLADTVDDLGAILLAILDMPERDTPKHRSMTTPQSKAVGYNAALAEVKARICEGVLDG